MMQAVIRFVVSKLLAVEIQQISFDAKYYYITRSEMSRLSSVHIIVKTHHCNLTVVQFLCFTHVSFVNLTSDRMILMTLLWETRCMNEANIQQIGS